MPDDPTPIASPAPEPPRSPWIDALVPVAALALLVLLVAGVLLLDAESGRVARHLPEPWRTGLEVVAFAVLFLVTHVGIKRWLRHLHERRSSRI